MSLMNKTNGLFLAEKIQPKLKNISVPKPVAKATTATKTHKNNKTKTATPKMPAQTTAKQSNPSQAQAEPFTLPTNINLSSSSISKLLGRFMNLRSTIRSMSCSVKQVEEWLDSTYNMFELAQMVNKTARNHKLKIKKADESELEIGKSIPLINLPKESTESNNLGSILQNINVGKVLQIIQSPLFVKALKYLTTRRKKA